MSAALDRAIEQLYTVFAGNPRPSVVDGCPHCVGEDETARLIAHPLRELSGEALARYSFKALTTWGTVDDLRYFLPRILELVPSGAIERNPQIVLGKLTHGEWKRWPQPEQEAIRTFVDAWFDTVIESPPVCDTSLDVLACVHVMELEIAPFLGRLERSARQSAEARAQLLVLAEDGSGFLRDGTMNPWLSAEASREIASWFARLDDALLAQAISEAPERDRDWRRELVAEMRSHA